jgi:hypothetical protein
MTSGNAARRSYRHARLAFAVHARALALGSENCREGQNQPALAGSSPGEAVETFMLPSQDVQLLNLERPHAPVVLFALPQLVVLLWIWLVH